jgi:hypothetical protein
MRRTQTIFAILAIAFGFTAAFTDHADKNRMFPDWRIEKQRMPTGKVHFISASHLADLLYQKKQGIRILDVRIEEAYEKYHIPSAKPYRDTDQESTESRTGHTEQANKNGMTVLYGNQGDPEVYRIAGTMNGKVYIVAGGIEAWYELVLFPDFQEFQVRNSTRARAIITRSHFFGGVPRNSQLLNITLRETSFREGC